MRMTTWIGALAAVAHVAGCGGGSTGSGGSSPAAATGPPPPAPGVTINPTRLTVEEGARATYTVVLEAAPTGNVTVTPASSDASAATVTGALTFTAGNWNTAQTVTVTGVEEEANDASDETVTVTHAVSGYGGVRTADSVAVTVSDNDLSADGIYLSARRSEDVQAMMLELMQEGVVVVFDEFIAALGTFELGELESALNLIERIVLDALQGRSVEELQPLIDELERELGALDILEPGDIDALRGAIEETLGTLDEGLAEFTEDFRAELRELTRLFGEDLGLGVSDVDGGFALTGAFVISGGSVIGVDVALGELFGTAVRIDGASMTGELQREPAIAEGPVAMTMSGTIADGSIELTLTDEDGGSCPLHLLYDDVHDRAASLPAWQGTWVQTEDGESVSSVTLDAGGTFLRQDADGCTAEGTLAVIHSDRNLYEVEMHVTSCDVDDGRHYGFAFLGDAASGGENNRGSFFVVKDGDEPDTWMTGWYSRQ